MSRSSRMLVTLFTIMALPYVGSSSGIPSGQAPSRLMRSVTDEMAEWSIYRNDEYGFQIRYPHNFKQADRPGALVANDAVVTFVPTYDLSINEAGDRTNLIFLSVTIGVSKCAGAPEQEVESRVPNHLASAGRGLSPRFIRSDQSEGAVGNRYETVRFATSDGGRRFEISLFVHSAHPGCYPAGTIALFDFAEVMQLFETMVRTFSLSVDSA